MSDELDLFIRQIAVDITGDPGIAPRPGQADLSRALLATMGSRGHHLGLAPTGTGKGVAYGAPAILRAIRHGERTLVSTEGKALQAQLAGKDFPQMARVAERLFGVRPTFAVHQGFANHPCPLSVASTLRTVLAAAGMDDSDLLVHAGRGVNLSDGDHDRNAEHLADLADDLEVAAGRLGSSAVDVEGRDLDLADLVPVLGWAARACLDDRVVSRADVDGDVRDDVWRTASVEPSECVGLKCPLRRICPAVKSREVSGACDIVVTNHTLLAVQAATGVAAVLDNQTLGHFDHLVVDECHNLPSVVRDAGKVTIDAARLRRLGRQVSDLAGIAGFRHAEAVAVNAAARRMADAVTDRLVAACGSGQQVFRPDHHPLGVLAQQLDTWAEQVLRQVPKPGRATDPRDKVKLARARTALQALRDDLSDSCDPAVDVARWVQASSWNGRASASCHHSPTDVAGKISSRLFQVSEPEPEAERKLRVKLGIPKPVDAAMVPLSVSMVSATLPRGFRYQVGLQADEVEYASPLTPAFDASLLFVPRMVDPVEVAEVARPDLRGRPKLDVDLFAQWASRKIPLLVDANRGSALVLSARAKDGKLYAERLREANLGVTVLSQWDGPDPQRLVAQWLADPTSVLVGTRSLMTGVDGAGDTCSLVVIDRPGRAPGNVVDDAMLDAMVARGVDRWAADRQVYVSPAALLMEQAAGRGIRRPSDRVVVACLEPRLMANVSLSYPEATRAEYMRAFRRFPHRTGTWQVVLDRLAVQAQAMGRTGRVLQPA